MAGPTYEELMAAATKLKDAGNADGARKMLEAAVRVRQNQPKTLLDTTKQVVGENIQQLGDVALMAGRGLTIGQSPNIQGAINVMLGGDFETGRQNQLAAEAAASERLGIMGMVPEIAGGIATGGAEVAAVKKLAGTPAAQKLGGWLGSILTGAAEGSVYAQGQGMDTTAGGLLGAGGALAGKSVMTGLGKIDDWLAPKLNVQQRAAEQISQQMQRSGVAPENIGATLQSEMDRLGPDAVLADVDLLRPRVTKAVNPEASIETAASAFNTATSPQRNIADLALTEWDSIFQTPRSINEKGVETKLTLDQAKAIYEQGLNNSPVKFKGDTFETIVTDAFGTKPIAGMKTARDALIESIRIKTPLVPDGKGGFVRDRMTARDLLDIKDSVDARIKDTTDGAADAKTKRHLTDISKQINETLKGYVPEIRTAADIYSGQYSFDAAYSNGYDLGKKGLKGQSLTDLREMVAGFTPQQKQAYAEGWRKAKFEGVDAAGAEKEFARIGPTKSNADLEIIDSLFGPGTGQQFVDVSKRINAISATNKDLLNSWKSVSGEAANPKGDSLNLLRIGADLLTMASQTAERKMMGGAFQGAFGREARAMGARGNALTNDQIVDWATRTGTSVEDALRQIEQYMARSKPQPIDPELLRSGIQTGTAAERSMRGR
jgi:hypothetical protein